MRREKRLAIIALAIVLFSALCIGQTSSHQKPPPRRIVCPSPEIRFETFVPPTYPRIAIAANLHGMVVLELTVDTTGRPTQIKAIQGHPLLVQAAISAAKQWRYKPFLLNGSPVEMIAQAQVNFVLPPRAKLANRSAHRPLVH
jgi:TonB family protein